MSTSPLNLRLSLKVDAWDESTVQELGDGSRISRCTAHFSFTDSPPLTSATLSMHYTLAHTQSHGSEYTGFGRLAGQWEGKAAELVLKEVAGYEKGKGSWSALEVVRGTGKGEWAGLQGKGKATGSEESAGGVIELELTQMA